ncbi:MAG: DEAD/DEAH box helicase, partial [Bacteroidales bacterium]|nr:DEAD/DEAH box helicase [Bacteroidales bacterium]
IERKYMSPRYPGHNNIEKYKVIIAESDGAAGQIGKPIPAQICGIPCVGNPYDSASSTFMSIGAFDSEEQAVNCSTYIKTKFLRCLLGILKVTQHTPPSVWAYIPLQDFTSSSDINWSATIEDIDMQLYQKYNLSDKEIAFIEKTIKPMK